MSNRRMSPQARSTYIVCLIICAIIAFNIFKTDSVLGAGVVGGFSALVAYIIAKLIVEGRGINFYIQNHQASYASSQVTAKKPKVYSDNELESWESIKTKKKG
jgi:hypothetical protein